MEETICWYCKNTNDCCWINKFKPVKGWTAELTIIKAINSQSKPVDSYCVKKCPNFKLSYKYVSLCDLSKIFKIPLKILYHLPSEKIIDMYNEKYKDLELIEYKVIKKRMFYAYAKGLRNGK